ncbi:hypothetical protein QFZ28_003145 [Neobacillus niacini]|nr:hypothetical protein [Neobacillus niacini]
MKTKTLNLLLIIVLVLTGCGGGKLDESLTLHDHNRNSITFPQENPTLFFFITTYT